ncbi:hypothetical protein D3C72_329070 [compost metagenome]
MLTRQYPDLTYARYGAIARLTERLRSAAIRRQPRYDDPELSAELDRAVSGWSVDSLLFNFLEHSVLSNDPRSEEAGRAKLADFAATHPGVDFTWDELVNAGLIKVVWGQWHLSVRIGQHTATELFEEFLVELSQTPWPEARQLEIRDCQRLLEVHKTAYPITPTLADLETLGLVSGQDERIFLNVRAKWAQQLADRLMAWLWESPHMPDDDNLRLDAWMERFELFNAGWEFDEFLLEASARRFREAALHRLVTDPSIVGWQLTINGISATSAVEHGASLSLNGSTLPLPADSRFDKLIWWSQPSLIDFHEVLDPYRKLRLLAHWLLKGWSFGRHSPESQLPEYLQAADDRPYLFKWLQEYCQQDPTPLAEIVTIPGNEVLALVLFADFTPYARQPLHTRDAEPSSVILLRDLWLNLLEFAFFSWLSPGRAQDPREAASSILTLNDWLAKRANAIVFNTGKPSPVAIELLSSFRDALFSLRSENGDAPGSWFIGNYESLIGVLRERIESQPHPAASSETDLLLQLMVERHLPPRREAPSLILDAYIRSMRAAQDWQYQPLKDKRGWTLALHWAHTQGTDRFDVILNLLATADGQPTAQGHHNVYAIRAHIRLLAMAAVDWPEPQPSERLLESLQAMVTAYRFVPRRGTHAQADRTLRLDPFQAKIMAWPIGSEKHLETSLSERIAQALLKYTRPQRHVFLEVFCEAHAEPLRLASLARYLTGNEDRAILHCGLEALPPVTDWELIGMGEKQQTIHELLAINAIELAEALLETVYDHAMTMSVEWRRWAFGARLAIADASEDPRHLMELQVPAALADSPEAEQDLRFYQAVAMQKQGDYDQAFQTLDWLRQTNRRRIEFALYAYVVKAQKVIIDIEGREPSPDEVNEIEEAVRFGEVVKLDYLASDVTRTQKVWEQTTLGLWKSSRRWREILDRANQLPRELLLDERIGASVVSALDATGKHMQADALRGDLAGQHGPQEPEAVPELPVINLVADTQRNQKNALIITEGKTDWMHLKAALKRLPQYQDLEIEFWEFETPPTDMGCDQLSKLVDAFKRFPFLDRMVIAIFDRDIPAIVNRMESREGDPIHHGNNVYSFCIPVPNHRPSHKGIAIEMYYSDQDLARQYPGPPTKRLYLSNQIEETKLLITRGHGKAETSYKVRLLARPDRSPKVLDNLKAFDQHLGDSWELDPDTPLALSKNDFAKCIQSENPPFDEMDFTQFQSIFDQIAKCLGMARAVAIQ